MKTCPRCNGHGRVFSEPFVIQLREGGRWSNWVDAATLEQAIQRAHATNWTDRVRVTVKGKQVWRGDPLPVSKETDR